jgi:uncharacterized protein
MASPTPPRSPRPMAAGHVIVVVALALLGGGVLNAQALTDAAARQPFGWQRTVAVVAATPFRGVAGLLGLDHPHRVLANAAVDATGGPAPATSEPPETANASAQPPPDPSGASDEPDATTEPTSPPTEAERTVRRATRRDPLAVWVGGDSLTSEFGPALADRLARTRRAGAEVEFRFSSGLARPDFFDWPARLSEIVAEHDPDVFVVMFGANDGQNIAVRGRVLEFNSPEWRREYARRVAAVIDVLGGDGRQLYWVGQPIARAADFDAKMQVLNEIYAEQADGRDDVTYVDTRSLFAGPDGAYAAYLEDDNGQSTLMRQQDGVHLTRAGGERLTSVIVSLLNERWPLSDDSDDG